MTLKKEKDQVLGNVSVSADWKIEESYLSLMSPDWGPVSWEASWFLLSGSYSQLPSELRDSMFLCFATTKFVVICFIRVENSCNCSKLYFRSSKIGPLLQLTLQTTRAQLGRRTSVQQFCTKLGKESQTPSNLWNIKHLSTRSLMLESRDYASLCTVG